METTSSGNGRGEPDTGLMSDVVLEAVEDNNSNSNNNGVHIEEEDLGQHVSLLHAKEEEGDAVETAGSRRKRRRRRLKIATNLAILFAGPLVFLVLCFVQIATSGKELPTTGVLFWVAWWWVTEIIPLGFTAFVPALVLPLIGVCTTEAVTACYLNPTIMLFVQSFLLASCVRKYNLHKRVALKVMLVTGTRPSGILLGSMLITAVLSMWMSNTATSAMMVPLVMSLYETLFQNQKREERSCEMSTQARLQAYQASDSFPVTPEKTSEMNGSGQHSTEHQSSGGVNMPASTPPSCRTNSRAKEEDEKSVKKFGKGLMLSVAYSASIGGTATLIGTGPNLVLMQAWEKVYGDSPSFLGWFGFGLTYTVAMLSILYIFLLSFFTTRKLPSATSSQLRLMLRDLGPYSWAERVVTASLLVVMLLWLTRKKPILGWGDAMKKSGASVHDYMPAMAAAIVLSIIPENNPFRKSSRKGGKILEMSAFKEVSWGVVFLLGGGVALSLGIEESGLLEYITSALNYLKGNVSKFVFPLLITTFVTFATEFVSNVAMSSIVLPILANIGTKSANLGLIPATLACSCAFMLPSATPPNALAYGSGLLNVFPDMVFSGLFMNCIGIGLITFWSIFIAPLFFPENTTSM